MDPIRRVVHEYPRALAYVVAAVTLILILQLIELVTQ